MTVNNTLKSKILRFAWPIFIRWNRLLMYYGRLWAFFHGCKYPFDSDSRMKFFRSMGL